MTVAKESDEVRLRGSQETIAGPATSASNLHMALSCLLIGLMLYLGLTLNVGYYARGDLLGPFSKFPSIFIALGIGTGLLIYSVTRNNQLARILSYTVVLVLLVYLIVLPSAIEPYQVTDFYDAPVHMSRAMYVAETGRSNIYANYYYDLQPGVFYATAAYVLITGITPLGLTKWFPLLFVAVAYIPALLFLGRCFFRDRTQIILYLCLTLLVTWPGRYHYSAQVYSLPLFIVVIGLLVRYVRTRAKNLEGVMVIFFLAIIVIHQLAALVTLAVLATALLWLLFKGEDRLRVRSVFFLTVFFMGSWLAYLALMTVFTFRNFLSTLIGILDLLLSGDLLSTIAGAVSRPDPLFQQLIIAKILFTGGTFIVSSFFLAYVWLKKRDISGLVLLMMSVISALIYLLGFPLGGRTYVERAVFFSGFLVAIGLAKGFSGMPRRRVFSLLKVVLLVALTLFGSALFNSNRNLQFVTYSEYASRVFLLHSEPSNVKLEFYDLRVVDLSMYVDYATLSSATPPYDALVYTLHRFIQRSYLEDPGFNVLEKADQNALLPKIYSNGVSSIYLVIHSQSNQSATVRVSELSVI